MYHQRHHVRVFQKQQCESLLSRFYVCRLQQWWKRKVVDAPSEADAGPTAAISCPHGQLLPEQATGAKRVLVSEDFWLFLYEDATSVKHDDLLVCPTFPLDSGECSECSNELSEVACMEDSMRLFSLFIAIDIELMQTYFNVNSVFVM